MDRQQEDNFDRDPCWEEGSGGSYLDSVVKVFSGLQKTPEAICLLGCNCHDQKFLWKTQHCRGIQEDDTTHFFFYLVFSLQQQKGAATADSFCEIHLDGTQRGRLTITKHKLKPVVIYENHTGGVRKGTDQPPPQTILQLQTQVL